MEEILLQYGIWGIFILAFLDHSGLPSGLFVGLSLVSAGVYEAGWIFFVVWLAGMIGDSLFYVLALFLGEPTRRFLEKYFHAHEALVKTEKAFQSYDSLFLVWARFVPFAGRYAPFVYGTFLRNTPRFFAFIALGNAVMIALFGGPILLLGAKAKAWFENPLTIFWLTLAILAGQALFVFLLSLWKRWKRA